MLKQRLDHFMNKQKDHAELSSLSFQNRLIVSYSFVMVLILVMGIFLYQISYQQMKEGINAQNTALLSSSIRKLDQTMSSISMVSQQLSGNSAFTDLVEYDDPGSSSFNYHAYLTQHELKPIFPLEHVLSVNSAFIYMRNSGYIISTSEFLPFESHAKYKLLCPPDMAVRFEEALSDTANRNRFISLAEFGSHRESYLYLYPIATGNVFSEKYIDAYLCCILDKDQLEDYFSGLIHEKSVITARNSSGDVRLLLSEGGASASLTHDILATTCQSEYNNWYYTLSQPREQAYYSIGRYRAIFMGICILAFVLEGVMVYGFSIINSRPVMRLANELVVKEKLASSLNDLIEKNRPLVIASQMRRIMEGSVTTDEEMEYIRHELHLNRDDVKYQVLYMEVYPSEDFNVQLHDMALCLQNFDVLVRDAIKRYFPDTGYLYKPSDRVFSVLIATPAASTYEQVMERNNEAFSKLHTELLRQYGIWSRGGFGGRNGLLSNTWKSYQQAKDAKSITTAEHYVQNYHDYINTSDTYYYPEIMSVQLTAAISTGNQDRVRELFKLIAKENTDSRTLSHIQRQQLLTDVRSTLSKKRLSLDAPSLEAPVSTIDCHTDAMKKKLDLIDRQLGGEINLDILKTIALKLCEFFTQESSSNELIIRIQQYITENYQDPSLCLTKISDEFNISENYFSFLFKKEIHENFSSYLEKLRMAKAKELVMNSDTGLTDLYQYLGYNNAASFRRVFKKTFGISPKEMREQANGR